MSTIFPAGIDSPVTLPTAVNNFTPVTANTVNILRDAIIAIESALGTLPQGIYSTVSARLDAIEAAEGGGGGGFIAGGDLSGSSIDQTVIGIQGRPVSPVAPSLNQVLLWNGTNWTPSNSSSLPSGPASGDLGGTYPGPSVVNIHGASVPIAGSLTTGNVLQVSGSSTLTYGPVNLAGGANYVVGTLPATNIPNLAGDTTGSITANINVKIQGRNIANIAPTDGYALTWVAANNDWEPAPKISLGIPNLATLRGTEGFTGASVIMGGYYVPGDGGGGEFYWDNSSSTGDDGGTVIVPTGSSTGRWVRIFDNAVNVKWWGAYGDAIHDDTIAIQNALNYFPTAIQNPAAQGSTAINVRMPAGVYYVTAQPNLPALSINQPTVLTGVGAGFVDEATRITCAGVSPYIGGSCVLTVEGVNSGAAGSKIEGILFEGRTANLPQDLLVIHASNVTVSNCGFAECWRYGICGSSGTTGTGPVDSAIGMSSIPGNGVNAHFAQILNCYAIDCGSIVPTLGGSQTGLGVQVTANFIQPAIQGNVTVQVNTTAPFTWDGRNPHPLGTLQLGIFGRDMYALVAVVDGYHITIQNVGAADSPDATLTTPGTSFGNGLWFNIGAGMIVYGVDANGWNVVSFNNGNCCNGTISYAQGSTTFTACYAQGTYYPHIDGAAGAETYVSCSQETVASCILQLGAQILVVGGSCATQLKGGGNNYPGIVSPVQSNLSFSSQMADGSTGLVQILPFASDAMFYLRRSLPGTVPQNWVVLQYQTGNTGGTWAANFQQSSWSFLSANLLGGQFTPFGFTDNNNTRGYGCAFISTPTINTPFHFTWKQSITLSPGNNFTYLNGGATDGGAIPFLTDPTYVQMDPTVLTAGTTPPTVTFTGTPTEGLKNLEVDITTGGTLPSVVFTWKINGVTQATGVSGAPVNVLLGSTGITVNFTAGTYATNNTYISSTQWANAHSAIKIDIEYTSPSNLMSSNAYVAGYSYVSEGGANRNLLYNIYNAGGASVAVNAVITYDVYVTNYETGSGSIG